MKLREFFSEKAGANSESSTPSGQQTNWLDFCDFVLKGSKILVVDAQFAPSAEDGLLVELTPGKYLVQAKVVNFGGDKRVARLRILPKKTAASRGAKLGETWTDTAKTGVCDYEVFSKAWGTDDDASYEKISPAFETEKRFGKATFDKASGAVLPFVDSGFGDGTFPVFELLADGNRVGLEIEFIAEGVAYPFGETPIERETRILLIKTKAEQGDAEAQWETGKMCVNRPGVEKDFAEAAKWYEKAAQNGHAEAASNLGCLFDLGRGVPQNYQRAFELYEFAAAKGFPMALNNLGLLHRYGRGTPINLPKAMECYLTAAKKGEANAQFNLGVHYQNGIGVEKNIEEALKWYRLGAEQEHPGAMCNLGHCHLNGIGLPENHKEAVRLFNLGAALKDHALCKNNLGDCYETGRGVKQDMKTAAMWYKSAAEQGVAIAQKNLGVLLKDGKGGVNQDLKSALQWLRKSAENGCEAAEYELGLLYEEGKGVEKNIVKACCHYQRAATKSFDKAVARLAELLPQLTDAECTAIQQ